MASASDDRIEEIFTPIQKIIVRHNGNMDLVKASDDFKKFRPEQQEFMPVMCVVAFKVLSLKAEILATSANDDLLFDKLCADIRTEFATEPRKEYLICFVGQLMRFIDVRRE